MERLSKLLILPVVFTCFFSCNNDYAQLDSLAQQLRTAPDSVLTELSKFNERALCKKATAYHALLLTAAQDLNYISFQDDSLIRLAYRYYEKHGRVHQKMLANYYYGLVQRDMKDFPSAIQSLNQAAALAHKEKAFLYEGLAHRTLCEIFMYQYEDLDAKNEIIKAMQVFEKAGLDEYRESARLRYGELLQQAGSKQLADSVFRVVIDNAQGYPLVNYAYRDLAYLQNIHSRVDAERVLDLYRKGGQFGYNAGDYSKMAYAYSYIDDSQIDSLFNEAYKNAHDAIDTAHIYFFKYLISKQKSNYKDALDYYRSDISIQDSIVTLKLQQSLTSSLNDIYKKDNRILRLRQQVARRNAIIALIIALLSSGCLTWRLIVKSRKNRDLSESIAETRRILQEREDGNLRLAKALVLEKIDQVQHAQERYMAAKGSEEEQAAYMDFRKQLGLLKNDRRLYANLATVLDEQHDGIATKVREDFPKMTDNNYELLLLMLAHFPQSTILLLKDATPGSLKTAKSRLRSALRKSDSPRKETYLSMLDN